MTNASDTNGPAEPIDADFEPAPAADNVRSIDNASRSGPGWLPLGLVGALSVGALGLSAMSLNQDRVDTAAFAPASITEKIETLRADQESARSGLASLRKSTEATEKRMAAQIEALLSGDDESEGLAALVAELESVSERLDEAMKSDSGAIDSEALDALAARLSVLEEADDGEAVSPRQMNRAVTALRERVKVLETQNEDLVSQLERRAEALATVTSRIEDLEFALQDVGALASQAQPDLLADLQKEMENLNSAIERTEDIDEENEARFADILKNLQAAGAAEVDVEQAESTASAALALSRIESAARDGRSFHAAYQQLKKAMPDKASVKALEPIARSGAPTLRKLTSQFAGDRDAALEAINQDVNDGWGWTRQVFGSGVKVRRAGQDGGPRDLLDKAEEALETGALKPAIEAVEQLPEEARAVMQDWLAGAQARLTLEDALDNIGVQMIGRDR